jgi:glutamate carboxypeptidase
VQDGAQGIGDYRLHVTGVAAHSGVDFARGHSAIWSWRGCCRRLRASPICAGADGESRRDLGRHAVERSGATRICAEVDVRIARASDAAEGRPAVSWLKCADPGCTLKITGGLNRPPMERKPGTVALYKQARRLAAELGFTLDEAATGGGSDGNFHRGAGRAHAGWAGRGGRRRARGA